MDEMNNSGPRFIEVYGTYEPHAVGDAVKEDEMDVFYINWCDVLRVNPIEDGWIVLTMRELDIGIDGDTLLAYQKKCALIWIKENLRHFIRRVNEGWAITEL